MPSYTCDTMQQMNFVTLLQQFLPLIGQASAVNTMRIEPCDENVTSVIVPLLGVGIDCGHPVGRKTIGGKKEFPGYRVWVIKVHPGNRWHPPEEEDITVLETLRVEEALGAIGGVVASDIAYNICMARAEQGE